MMIYKKLDILTIFFVVFILVAVSLSLPIRVKSREDSEQRVMMKTEGGEKLDRLTMKQQAEGFHIKRWNIDPEQVEPGEQVDIDVQVENRGENFDDFTLELLVDGDLEEWQTASLGSNESMMMNFAFSREETGEYNVTVRTADDGRTGTIEVVPISPLDVRIPNDDEYREWIYEGETFKADIEVHNRWTEELNGVDLLVEEDDLIREYGIGTLEADETKIREIRISPEDYEKGENEIEVEARHDYGRSSLNIDFRVLSDTEPVGVFLASTNSPVYERQTLEFSLVVAAAQSSGVQELVIESKAENLTPEGYWVGEEMKKVGEMEGIESIGDDDLSSIIGGENILPETENTQQDPRVVVGRRLIFEKRNTGENGGSLNFDLSYELGNRSVEREFEIEYEVKSLGSVSLVEADPTSGEKGETLIVSLEISNEKDIDIEGVKVRPVETSDVDPEEVDIYPSPYYWIGPMEADGFLPVEIRVDSEDLEDGDTLKFEPVYRVGDGELTGSPVEVTVELSEPERDLQILYYLGFGAIVGFVIFVYYWRKR